MNSPTVSPPIGVVEGFYGRAWEEGERLDFLDFAARVGIDFYLYAPKADAFLRRRWREPYPEKSREFLERIAARAAKNGVAFGVGLSPYELYREWNPETRRSLRERLEMIREVGAETLGLFFDDMKGDQERLAELQSEIASFAGELLPDVRIVLCPTYYSDDPVLDRMFGARPEGYLERLGERLDPGVEVVWTGPKICSDVYPREHLEGVRRALGRKLWLWDNYPVNDGPRMCPFLHLRAFRGRGAVIAPFVSAHAINPMNQSVLSRIPILTELASRECARGGLDYRPEVVWRKAALEVTGDPDLAARVERDLSAFQDTGWRNLPNEAKAEMSAAYRRFPVSAVREEVLAWLAGESQTTDAETFLSQ